jgi:hypothetical protein
MYIWNRRDTNTNKIVISSKLEDNDVRLKLWEEKEDEIKEFGISKIFKNYNGYEYYELQYWIDKNLDNEMEKIKEFKNKCEEWNLGKLIEKDIILSKNDDIDLNKFNFIQDDGYNDEWENYLFTYENKNLILKTPIMNIEVFCDNFNNKYIEIPEDNDFINFIKNIESRIKNLVNEKDDNYGINMNEYIYKSNNDNNGNYRFKIKKDNIDIKEYKNVYIYIKYNRLWKLSYQKQGKEVHSWGVSLVVDKIIEVNN